MNSKLENKIYTLMYTLAYFPLLINNGVYWDDWCIFNSLDSTKNLLYKVSGRPFFGIFFEYLFKISQSNLMLIHFFIFTAYLVGGFLLEKVLKTVESLSEFLRFVIILSYFLIPVNFAKVAITNFQYGFCLFLFNLAWYIFVQFLKNKNIFFRIFSLILFYISFTTESLLFYYILPIGYLYFYENKKIKNIIKKYWDFLIIPILFALAKLIFFRPYDLYEGFNSPSFNLLQSYKNIRYTIENSTINLLIELINEVKLNYISFIVIFIFVYFLLKKVFMDFKVFIDKEQFDLKKLGIGFLILIIVTLPYILVGKIGSSNDWDSRHQILLPLGVSILFTSLITGFASFFKNKFKTSLIMYSLLFSSYILYNFNTFVNYQVDWWKQLSVASAMEKSYEMKNATTFYFSDKLLDLNARYRNFRDYEYSGLMKYVFNEENRYGTNQKNLNFKDLELEVKYPWYNVLNYTPNKFDYQIEISAGSLEINSLNIFIIYKNSFLHKEKFKENIANITKLKISKMY